MSFSGNYITHRPHISSEQANTLFTSILHTEVEPESPQRPGSPTRQPIASTSVLPSTPSRTPSRKIFNYHTNPPTPSSRLDNPSDVNYQVSPVNADSRALLESPRQKPRSVCKTPYRVLDAPELAEDFYLNLVDWSSTNVLGVGLGSCVYLWTAHNATVNKLCDLSDNSDTISSVAWVQKVTIPNLTKKYSNFEIGLYPRDWHPFGETSHLRRG